MSHLEAFRPVAYRALEGPPDIEIVLNNRDAPPPREVFTIDGRVARLLPGTPLPGRPRLIPLDWAPVPGVTREFRDATETWALLHAEQMAVYMWEWPEAQRVHETREDLAAVLLQGLLEEVRRGAAAIAIIEEERPDGSQD